MRHFIFVLGLLLPGSWTLGAAAHEFWISPENYQVDPLEAIRADIRVGQNFEGSRYSFLPKNFERFDIVIDGQVIAVEGTLGDRPALNMAVPGEGLAVVVHETTDSRLTYSEWVKFTNFVAHKAFPGVLEAHAARGLPETGFVESYRRFAKSLIAVGNGAGRDKEVGLTTEIVALANPFTDDTSGGLPVKVLYRGAPRADAQLEVFDKDPTGEVEVTLYRTDDAGQATVPVAPGHSYLLDAVVLRDTGNNDPDAGPVWHSLWASLTFHVPE